MLTTVFIGCGGGRVMRVIPSEADAKVFLDNQYYGTGSVDIKFAEPSSAMIKVEKPGYLTWGPYLFENASNKNVTGRLDVKMEKDESLDASALSDVANKGFTQVVNKKLSEDRAWKVISSIVTSYFDEVETSDKSTGYLKTAWVAQPFNNGQIMIRTRVLIKGISGDNLAYQIKLSSERAETLPNQKIKVNDDEKFKSWDRVLRKYNELISEFQNRLK